MDDNFQDYEFTRLNTYEKKEMSEELTIILSNNYYWNQLLREFDVRYTPSADEEKTEKNK